MIELQNRRTIVQFQFQLIVKIIFQKPDVIKVLLRNT